MNNNELSNTEARIEELDKIIVKQIRLANGANGFTNIIADRLSELKKQKDLLTKESN